MGSGSPHPAKCHLFPPGSQQKGRKRASKASALQQERPKVFHLLCMPAPRTVPSPSPYIRYPGTVANKRVAYIQHAPGARRQGGQGEQGPGTQPWTLTVSLTEMRGPYPTGVCATAGPSISGKEWAPVGGWGTYLSVEILSDVKSTNESSLGKGISKKLTATLKIRQAPGVP